MVIFGKKIFFDPEQCVYAGQSKGGDLNDLVQIN
jgi:hypothetical protein